MEDNKIIEDNKITLELALEKYILSLDNVEKLVLEVAKRQLESSFEIYKSIGFLDFLKQNSYVIISDSK